MSQSKINEEHNVVIAKSPRNCNFPTNRCMPFVRYLKVEKVMHTMSRNPYNNVDD